jgi:tetratricopeptide (TPR) repeat protein
MESGAAPAPKAADLDEETLAQLAALGYMAGQGGVSAAEEGDTPRADPKDKVGLHHAIMSAQGALGEGDLAAARRALEGALAADAGILDAHQMLGGIAAQEEKWEEAIASYRRALALDPEHKASLFGLAAAYRRTGRADEALVGFERLLAIAPQDSKAAIAAADLLVEKGRRPDALALLERASKAAEAPPILANQLGELLAEEKRTDAARAEFERAIAANPELAQPHFNLGVLAEESGDAATAVRRYEETLALQPKHLQALFNLGRLAGATGDRARQEALWRDAIEAHPDFTRGRYLLAKLLMDTGGDLAEAERLVRDGLAGDPENAAGPLGYFLLADILNRSDRPAEAAAALATGREIQTRSAPGARASPTRRPG